MEWLALVLQVIWEEENVYKTTLKKLCKKIQL